MKLPSIAGYTYKQFPPVRLLIRDDLISLYSDSAWQDFCQGLFHGTGGVQLRKQTTYKSIFTLRFPPANAGTLCVVKKYSSGGVIKSAKEYFQPSKAFHEFQTAISISGKDIPTPAPLLVAELMSYGRVSESLLISQCIADAYDLKDFLINRQSDITPAQLMRKRWETVEALGRLTAKIFNCGIYQDDYALNNFILKQCGGGSEIYFIDFERVEIKDRLSEQEKTKLLTKLNRVGCEVTIKDRLRFLRSYLKEDTGTHKDLKQYARELQRTTLVMLKRDLQRGRLTSVYTAETYKKFKIKGYYGICHKSYKAEDLLNQVRSIPQHENQDIISLNCGTESHTLKLLRFKGDGAEKIWAAINVLKLAGLPIDMPQGFSETKSDGILMMKIPESGDFQTFQAVCQRAGVRVMKVLETHFPEQLKNFSDLLTRLNT
jgi:tRNA A-37 threonylcarbamoyl transferase component Bud32